MNTYRILTGSCLETLPTLAPESVQCCVTSPPYWGLRDYGHPGQFGLEKTPQEYVENMLRVFREVRRVLRNDGVLWLNLGDSYAGGNGTTGNNPSSKSTLTTNNGKGPKPGDKFSAANAGAFIVRDHGMKRKDLVGIPWRVAFALQADGWWLRSDCIWSKPNPMPESVTDRPTKAHEYVFMLSKSERYYFDAGSVREQAFYGNHHRNVTTQQASNVPNASPHRGLRECPGPEAGRNIRTVWQIATEPCKEAHFAVMPRALARRCILAGCPVGGTVLDPFGGAGTVALESVASQRNAVICELNPEYADIARRRLRSEVPMFATEAA